jgi:hypothetical protein
MRRGRNHKFIVIVSLAAFSLNLIAGCGSGREDWLSGVWTGTPNRAAEGSVEVDFTATGSDVTGFARVVTLTGDIYRGDFTGNQYEVSVSGFVRWIPPGLGQTGFGGTRDGDRIFTSYTLPGAAIGDGITYLAKSSATTPANISGTFSGSGVINDQQFTISISNEQIGHSLNGYLTTAETGATSTIWALTGTIIGNHIIAVGSLLGQTSIVLDGTLNRKVLSGAWSDTGTQDPQSGTFSLTRR